MTWEEFLAALGQLPEGQKLIEAIKAIVAGKDAEIKTKGKEVTTAKTAQKKAETDLAAANERLEIFQDALEIDGDTEDLDEAIAEAKTKLQAAKDGDTKAADLAQVQSELKKVQREYKKLEKISADNEKLLGEERGKRHTSMKTQALLTALTENKAIKPDQLAKLLLNNVKVGDDDKLLFVNEDGDEINVGEGVKGWLETNQEFVLNSQNPGGGSGGGLGNGNQGSFAKSILESGQQSERIQKGAEFYFGNNQ
ncbi:MAG: hypothetical protein E6713_17550 [Sporomusaceae bacterium]|nr:hypothetical protein [Sporomusaceae bacterium]